MTSTSMLLVACALALAGSARGQPAAAVACEARTSCNECLQRSGNASSCNFCVRFDENDAIEACRATPCDNRTGDVHSFASACPRYVASAVPGASARRCVCVRAAPTATTPRSVAHSVRAGQRDRVRDAAVGDCARRATLGKRGRGGRHREGANRVLVEGSTEEASVVGSSFCGRTETRLIDIAIDRPRTHWQAHSAVLFAAGVQLARARRVCAARGLLLLCALCAALLWRDEHRRVAAGRAARNAVRSCRRGAARRRRTSNGLTTQARQRGASLVAAAVDDAAAALAGDWRARRDGVGRRGGAARSAGHVCVGVDQLLALHQCVRTARARASC